MVSIGSAAQDHFRRLIQQQGDDILGLRLKVARAGTPAADCQLEFCEQADLRGDEWVVECEGFNVYLDADSVRYLEGAEIDIAKTATGSQLTIRAPNIKGHEPGPDAGLAERVQHVLEAEVNPQLASHGGRVKLVSIEADGGIVLQFGGGCHGCGAVDTTLRHGIEKTLKERFPEITAVRDATDHSTGENPYIRRAG